MDNSGIPAGTFVRLRTDPSRAGILQPDEKILAEQRMVPVRFPDGSVAWLPEAALEPVPALAAPLIDRFADGRFVDPEWLRRTLARLRVTGRLGDIVYSMEATETDFYAYQFKPVLKLLNSPTDGLLIADEVGLGKTIEAGLIWTELRARLESNRLLVLCPKTLCPKWRIELDRRFGVDARIVDAQELHQLLSTSGGRGFAAIASMQALRPPRGWNETAENPDTQLPSQHRLAQFLDEAAEGPALLDLMVIDEAHHMRNPETMLHQLAQLLNGVTSHRVFLSATPIHLRNRDLHSLLRLIDPDTFEYEHTLDELILMNAPIVEARDLLLKSGTSRDVVLERLEAVQARGFLTGSRVLELLREELRTTQLDERRRAEFASRLEQINQLSNYVTRTRRRDVEEFRVRRDIKAPTLSMDPLERSFYEAVTDEVAAYAYERDTNEGFLLSMPQRLLTSSTAAASEYWASYDIVDREPEEGWDEDLVEDRAVDKPLVSRLAALARRLSLTEDLARVDTKYKLLLTQLRLLWKEEHAAKIIVFSSFKPTLRYLRRRLVDDGISNELLHGSVKEPRESILERFQSGDAKVLLSSEIGSEGVDLQFSSIVVNYDLPWNPMKIEQRIGRVDRLGQTKPVVAVLNLIYADTIDEKIYQRLYKRLGLGERALGEFETVLGDPIREMTHKLLDPRLSETQKVAAIDQAAQAVQNAKVHEEQLEADAGALIQHGDFILQKITESRSLHRWLHGSDVLVYVRDRLRRSFEGCSVEASPPGSDTYRITLSQEARQAFSSFVMRRGFYGMTRLVDGNDEQRYRFTSSVTRSSGGKIESISQMHPIVRFTADLDIGDDSGKQTEPVSATLSRQHTPTFSAPGAYVLSLRRWVANGGDAGPSNLTRIAYAGAELNTGDTLSPDAAEALAAATAEHGRPLSNLATDHRLLSATHLLRDVVLPELDRRFEEFVGQITAQIEDRATIRRRALERHRDTKVAKLMEVRDSHRAKSVWYGQIGDEPRSKRSLAQVTRADNKIRKLRESTELRLKEIESEQELTPEVSDIASLFVEVHG